MLIVNGEELGVLLYDGKPIKTRTGLKVEYLPLVTKYGEFDMVHKMDISLPSVLDTYTITLNGKYVATVSGKR